jgi:oligopeptide transport system substrate-binding protein
MKKRTLFSVILLAGLLALTYWSWKQLKLKPLESTTLNLALDNAVESLDPAKAFSDDSLVVSSQSLEPLYQYHYLKRPYEIQPLLAEALPQVSKKGTILTIKIKKGIAYHLHPSLTKGRREVRAEDFVNQIKRLTLKSLNSPGRSIFNDLIIGFDSYADLIRHDWRKISKVAMEGVVAVDDHTLEFHLKKPEPNFTYYLALNFVVPVPWELIEAEKNNLDKTLLGTGPYAFTGFDGKAFEFSKNPQYREDFYPTSGDRYANVQKLLDSSKERIPFIDHVKFYLTQESERWDLFMNHEIDLVTVPKTYIPRIYDKNGELSRELQEENIKLKHFPILANRWFAFNMRDPILGKNLYLRKAIASAIDYTEYIQITSQNTNLRANSILVPGIAGYQPTKDFRFQYDLEKSKEYLALAGFSDPNSLPVIRYSTRGTQEIHLLEAEFVKAQLAKIGLKVEIEVLNFSDFLRKGRAGELMFFTDNWLFDYPDGENIVQLLISSNFPGVNKAGYSNPKVDALYSELRETVNQEEREKIFSEIEDIIFDDLPWIPMMYESSFVLQYPELKNFRKSSIIRNYVKYLKIEN